MATINEKGMQEIASFLAEYHKLGGGVAVGSMLSAWASEAEESLDAENGAQIEIPASDSVTGSPIVFWVSDAGVDFD